MNRQYKGHGHHRLAPRSAFDDRLVGVRVLFLYTTKGGGDNKTKNDP
jgi:hypothetical protein